MIDERAIVHPSASLGADVEVGPFSVVGADVEIGEGTWIGPHVVIKGPTRIGRNNQIFQFSSVGDAPQDITYTGEATRLEIGDENIVREYCTLNRGTPRGGGVTRVGNQNLLMAYTHVAHDCQVGDHTIFANGASLGGHVRIEDHVVLGGFALIHQFVRVGAHSFCGMGCGVSKDVPPFLVVSGNPAHPHGVNVVGLKRRGFEESRLRMLRKAYKIIYRSNLKLEQAVAELLKFSAKNQEVAQLVEFIESSNRSIVR